MPFSNKEFKSAIIKCNNSSTPRPDYISWKHLKAVIKDERCLVNIVNIANACINISHWLSHFKKSSFIIISKPNKTSYDSPKIFCPIILLNTLERLIKKVIGERLQFHLISNNFIHPNQLGGLKQQSTTNVGIFFTYLIYLEWVKNL